MRLAYIYQLSLQVRTLSQYLMGKEIFNMRNF